MTGIWRFIGVCGIVCVLGGVGHAQRQATIVNVRAAVTYVSGAAAYVGAGREQRLAVGDTITFEKSGKAIGRGVVAAVSARSSMVPLEGGARAVAVGDSVTARLWRRPEPVVTQGPKGRGESGAALSPPLVTGRIALQYFGMRSAEGFTTSLPTLMANLSMPALFGSRISFSLHGRVSRELADASQLNFSRTRTNVRIYDAAFRLEPAGNGAGFGLGRVTPRYAAGLGPLDGVEAFVRSGRFTTGILGGFQPDYANSGIDTYRQKAALFVNYGWPSAGNGGGDVTLAYGRLMYRGKLDRDFMYLQSSMRLGSAFFLYQSTEIDIVGLDGAARTSKPRLTNTFVNISVSPTDWLTLDGGYDATRMVYYLESMNVRSDTIMDNTVRQGIRGGMMIRLPARIQIGGRINVRPRIADLRTSRTIIGTFRMGNILQTGASLGLMGATIKGTYADGTNFSGNIDYSFPSGSSLTLSAEQYAYTLFRSKEKQTTTTASLMLQMILGSRWYLFGGFDQVWENDRPLQRIIAELGFRL
ncbi:MAG: hypothetical protein IPI01_07820 [Ignavibacteriae bacterium]|nr:hypothetical protein [Ignavibacteriota bacterium]